MKFTTSDENDIWWIHNYRDTAAGDTIQKIMDAGKWDEFLGLHQDENGEVDCDGLYDYLRHAGECALLDVGLHETESTHPIEEVLAAWERENEPYKVSRCEDGKPSGLMLFHCRLGETYLDFEYLDEDGEVQSESLDEYEVFDLVGDNNSTEGAWTGHDTETDVFECWRGRD